MSHEFVTPDFLLNHSTDEVHKIMKDILPVDIDTSEGNHVWNLTRPTALVVARLCEFVLPEVIKLIFPYSSYGTYLDDHGEVRRIARKEATAAIGEITITGEPGSKIPAGSQFSTASINDDPAVFYETLEDAEIPDSGSITVTVQCTETGIIGNTAKNTIIFPASRLTGITGVNNAEAITGGTEVEDDAALIERIMEFDRTHSESFIGNPADYRRWAMSVDGVGAAVVISAQDDTGLVTIILVDSNGAPATQELCDEVYNYIMRPDDEYERLAPVNAYLSVIPPETLIISVKATIEMDFEATLESVQANFMAQLALYIPEALEDNEIKFTRVGAILSSINGVNDYMDLQIGLKQADGSVTYGGKNIPITSRQLPIIEAENLILSVGTV